MSLLLESTIKGALIVLFALGLMPLLRHQSAALRHWVLAAALACAALAPFARVAVPSWRWPIALAGTRDVQPPDSALGDAAANVNGNDRGSTTRDIRSVAPTEWSGYSAIRVLPALWLAGAAVGIGILLVGLVRLARLASGARPISTGIWVERAEQIGREYGLRRPVQLLQGSHPTLLVTWGVVRPRILLPARAARWQEDRVSFVLCHELAHVRRRDWIVQLAAELLRAICWVNPFVWIACNRLRQESEHACDDAVLNYRGDGTAYATHLLDIARELQRRRMWVPAPSIARPSSLERRVRAMLDIHVNRGPLSRRACAATLLALLSIAVPVAGVAIAQAFGTVAGSIVDPMNGALPDVTLVLTNVQNNSKYEVRSDRAGRYEFVGLAPGEYRLEAKLPGFAVLHGTLTVAGQNIQQDLKLQVGSLEETITVRDKYVPGAPAAHHSQPQQRPNPRPAPACGSTPSPGGTPIGGNIRPPAKLVDVRPQYPASMLSAGVEGTVVLRARIGSDGNVEEATVVSTPHPDLGSAAADAVRQWEFDPTYLNCVAIPVEMKVTVNFERER
jgi:TonB family protein